MIFLVTLKSICYVESTVFFLLIFVIFFIALRALNWDKLKDPILSFTPRLLLSDFHLAQVAPTHLPMTRYAKECVCSVDSYYYLVPVLIVCEDQEPWVF